MRATKQKVTLDHAKRLIAADAVLNLINYRDMTKEQAQAELFAMAERGEGRPKKGHPLYRRWYNYICKGCSAYDSKFVSEHSSKYPLWHIKLSEQVAAAQERFISMQIKGCKKPKAKSKDYNNFHTYLRNYPMFVSDCLAIKNNWVPDGSHGTLGGKRKNLLIQMAYKGAKQPNCKDPLYDWLRKFTGKGYCIYDSFFTNLMRKICNNWPLLAQKER